MTDIQAVTESESKEPAPGALALVQAFVNTRDFEESRDDLSTPAGLDAWLRERGLLEGDAGLREGDHRRAIAVREALRALLLAHNGEAVDPDAVATLNDVAAAAPLEVRFAGDGAAALDPAGGGLDAALAHLLAIVYTATVDGTWARLKACRSDTCQWAFYDHSKNRSGAWCSMATCGSRVKARTYRQRQRQDSVPQHGQQRSPRAHQHA